LPETRRLKLPRWLAPVLGILAVGMAYMLARIWHDEPPLALADYVGTIDVSTDDAKLYRDVPFDWTVRSSANAFSGHDIAHVRIDTSGELVVVCGWLKREDKPASYRAARWLSGARLKVGEVWIAAMFIAPSDKPPGDPSAPLGTGGLNAGCARLAKDRPPADAPMELAGRGARE
jgi:hypothetical protein